MLGTLGSASKSYPGIGIPYLTYPCNIAPTKTINKRARTLCTGGCKTNKRSHPTNQSINQPIKSINQINQPINQSIKRVLAIYQIMLGWKTYECYHETDELFPTKGQPNPRKNRLKVAFGPLVSTANTFSWAGIASIYGTDYKKPNSTKFSASTLLIINRSIDQAIYQAILRSINQPINQSINRSINQAMK